MLRAIFAAAYVRMAAAAGRNRRSATATNLEHLRGTVETKIPAAHALDDGSGERVPAI